MAISKTRNLLVDVARQLFARNGVDDTTMNDIALASKKGRRTLYTYFKSKEDIYWAVIESELDRLSQEMKKVAVKDISPDEKILELIYARLNIVKEVVYRNGTLRASFFRDIWTVEAYVIITAPMDGTLERALEVLEDGTYERILALPTRRGK